MLHLDPDNGDNRTELIFCRENVDPELVSRMLELRPTESYEVGDVAPIGNGFERRSNVGMWKLRLPTHQTAETVEEQLGQWVTFLRPKVERLARLRQLGYRPYLDCRAESRSLSLCVDPEVLAGLGALGVALSVWLYEAPAAAMPDRPA